MAMQRREFLIESGQAALGLSVLAVSACSPRTRNSAGRSDVFLTSLVAGWEAGIPQWLAEAKMPAVSIAIIRDGRIAWRRGFGVKDTGTDEPVDTDTVFAACSDTKPVFAYGVVKLCEKGAMDLDTPLTRYTSRRIRRSWRGLSVGEYRYFLSSFDRSTAKLPQIAEAREAVRRLA
jgi:CubicO group peptidase (beta-lactamase class C family)